MTVERACTMHAKEPVEAETIVQMGLTYLMLRCTICNRPQGMRLVRKSTIQSSKENHPSCPPT